MSNEQKRQTIALALVLFGLMLAAVAAVLFRFSASFPRLGATENKQTSQAAPERSAAPGGRIAAAGPSSEAAEPRRSFGMKDQEQELLRRWPAASATILLIGADSRPGDPSLGNSDVLIVAHIQPQSRNVALLSIPRDTMVNLPRFGKQKINAAARLCGGWSGTRAVIEDLIGYPINGYVKVNFASFKEIVDTLGGVTVNVEKDMYYVTGDKQDGVINLKKGTQRLNGAQALQYARFRHDRLGDVGRTARQQELLKAVARELGQPKTLVKLPWLIPQLYRAVESDLTVSQVVAFAGLLRNPESLNIVSQTLPGYFAEEKKISYWMVKPEQCREVVHQFFAEGKTSEVFVVPPARPAFGEFGGHRDAAGSTQQGGSGMPVDSPQSATEFVPVDEVTVESLPSQ